MFRIWFCTLFILVFSPLALAQSVTDGVIINARYMERDMEKRTVKLNGDVQVVFKGQHMSSDSAQLDLNKQQIIAEGNVVLYNDQVHVEGDKVVFNYSTNTGLIYNGYVQSGQVVFQGDVVEKTGENHYIATNADYTACETCPPGWSLSGKTIDAEIGGYARISRPVFHIAGFPVMILPGLIVPLKSSRQSGVLVPTWGQSGLSGFSISAIYFWAINRSSDMTFQARDYTLRGYKFLDQYRYVLSPDSRGQADGAWMVDKVLKNEYQLPGNGVVDRWFLNYDHLQNLPNGYVDRLDVRDVSDLRYIRDFPDELPGYGDPALENKASITKLMPRSYASAEADIYENQLKYYPFQSNNDSVNRAPDLKYSFEEQRLWEGGPLARMDLDYTNFTRSSWGYDDLAPCNGNMFDPKGRVSIPCTGFPYGNSSLVPIDHGANQQGQISRDGVFTSGQDLWRTGQRLDVMPTISYPFQLWKTFDILPSVTYRETQYQFDSPDYVRSQFDSTAARRYVETDVTARTEFSRVFTTSDDPKATKWKHSIEPEVTYSQIPWARTPNNPFFGDYAGFQYARQFDPITDTDIGNPRTGVQFDYNDRTFEERAITYGLLNRFTRKVWNDGTPDYQTIGVFQLDESYDFKEAQRASPGNPSHPWSMINGILDLRFDHLKSYTTASFSPYPPHVWDLQSNIRAMYTPKNYVQISYSRNWILDNTYQPVITNPESRSYSLGAGTVSKYFDFDGHLDFTDLWNDPITGLRKSGVQVLGWGYTMDIRPPGRCWVIRVDHSMVLGGDATIHASLNFDFGGETKTEASTRSQAM